MELAPVAEEARGMFFGGDSYVIKYTYEKEGREQYIVYFWQVRATREVRLYCVPLTAHECTAYTCTAYFWQGRSGDSVT